METYRYPDSALWPALTARAREAEAPEVAATVSEIIAEVRRDGDQALRRLEKRFTGADIDTLLVDEQEIDEAVSTVDPSLREAIDRAAANIEAFHGAQMARAMTPLTVETAPGVTCAQKAVPIDTVGLYVPGGNSPLFSTVLMLAIPARTAGCRQKVLCTPCGADGKINPAILYACRRAGVDKVFRTGGAQAIAAMALGTESIPAVDKILGPGNRFVTEAKQQVAGRITSIDMPAGPSEVLVMADDTADASLVAADFLSQAEHGPDSQSVLLTTSERLADSLPGVIEELLAGLPRAEMMRSSLEHSRLILLHDDAEMLRFSNLYAPEHLIINHADPVRMAAGVRNAGSVFLGPWSPESVGDYASGTNHTLPTSGWARSCSGVNIDTYIKKITFQQLTPQGIAAIGPTVETMAEGEDLHAHRLAVTLRLKKLDNTK